MIRCVLSAIALSAVISTTACDSPPAPPVAEAGAFEPGTLHPDAPPETELLGQLAGVWDVTQEIRQQDGSWGEPQSAEWRFYYTLDGHAVQDDWIKDGTLGTNIRIYNRELERWDMAWIDSTSRKLATFTAVNDGESVVMTGENASGRPIRNTFFNIAATTFEWQQEWTFDEGATWVVVTRMRATRRDESAS